jgi:hypothetical protein
MRQKWFPLVLALVMVLVLATGALAMSSSNYRINWMVPLSGGGGAGSSANYAVKLTLGQTVVQSGTSAGYQATLGFWSISAQQSPVFLPVIKR